jgi:hypothetical protein
MSDDKLQPVCVPPLATVLAAAAQKKRLRLTGPEVLALRDQAAAIAMNASEAAKLEASRGYRDVNPEDPWADWHRLRVEFTGDGCLPRIVLCLAGDNLACHTTALDAAGIEHDLRGRDDRMEAAFRASSFGLSSVGPKELERVGGHTEVLYVVGKNTTAKQAPEFALELLNSSAAILAAGVPAIKCESSGIAHSAGRWIELAREAAEPGFVRCSALFRAYVQLPISDPRDLYSCGMHLLGRPDFIVSHAAIADAYPGQPSAMAVSDLFGTFGLYLLDECPAGDFRSGNTFRARSDAPRFRVIWEECTGYEEDDFFFNPFGRWRLGHVGV